MKKEITKTDEQDDTELSTFQPINEMIIWRDVAIQLRKLSPSDVAEVCSTIYTDRSKEGWRQLYYDWIKINEFKPWLLSEYANHFKGELAAKGYARLHDRVDTEKDVSKIIEVIELAEGKKEINNTQVNVLQGLVIIKNSQND